MRRAARLSPTPTRLVVDPIGCPDVRAMVDGGFDGCGAVPTMRRTRKPGREMRRGCAGRALSRARRRRSRRASGRMQHGFTSRVSGGGGFDAQFSSLATTSTFAGACGRRASRSAIARRPSSGTFRRNTVKAYYGQHAARPRRGGALSEYPNASSTWPDQMARHDSGPRATVPARCAAVSDERGPMAPARRCMHEVPGILSFLPQTLEWNLVFAAGAL